VSNFTPFASASAAKIVRSPQQPRRMEPGIGANCFPNSALATYLAIFNAHGTQNHRYSGQGRDGMRPGNQITARGSKHSSLRLRGNDAIRNPEGSEAEIILHLIRADWMRWHNESAPDKTIHRFRLRSRSVVKPR
jgi:hypothetical protein